MWSTEWKVGANAVTKYEKKRQPQRGRQRTHIEPAQESPGHQDSLE